MRGVWKLGSWAFQDVVIMSPYTVSLTMDRLIGKLVIIHDLCIPADYCCNKIVFKILHLQDCP